jgi:hypothetical protein
LLFSSSVAGGDDDDGGREKMREPGWPGASQARTLAVQCASWEGVIGLGPTEFWSSLETREACIRRVGVIVVSGLLEVKDGFPEDGDEVKEEEEGGARGVRGEDGGRGGGEEVQP